MVEIPCQNCGTPVDASGGTCPECGFRQMTLPWALQYFVRTLLTPFAAAILYVVLAFLFPDLMGSGLVTALFGLAVVGLMAYNLVVVSYRFLRRRKLIRDAKADQRRAASGASGGGDAGAAESTPDASSGSSDAGDGGTESSTAGDSSGGSVDVDPVLLTNRTGLDLDDDATVADALAAADLDADVDDVADDLDLGVGSFEDAERYETSAPINLNATAIGLGMDAVTDVEEFPGLAYHGEESGDAVFFPTGEVVLFADAGADPDELRTDVESTLTGLGVVGG